MSANRKRLLNGSTENGLANPKKSRRHEPATSTQNTVQPKPGTIKQISLKNFMCHSHLEVNFKGNICFVTGRNGSGKSAILTALVVGLAGRANFTNRGKSMKGFVKAGKNSASVEIILNNSGEEAFKPSIYGDEIVIQRQFTAAGSSSYKIKSATGQIISKSAKTIQHIINCLNIQIDNPICILNQDTSRNFLSTSNAKQKFILFMRATRLETLQEEYKKISNNRRQCVSTFQEKKRDKQQLKNLIDELEKKIENFQSVDRLKNVLVHLQEEFLWAKVRDAENEYNSQMKIVEGLQSNYNSYEGNTKNKGKRLEEIKQKVGELQQQILQLKEQSEILNRPQLDLQNQLEQLKQSQSEKRRKKQLLLKQIDDKNRNIVNLTKEIEGFVANCTQVEQEKLKRKKDMVELKGQIDHIENMIETTQNDMFQMRSSISREEERENDLQQELRQKRNKHVDISNEINNLKTETDSLIVYGREMPEIVNAIQRNKHRFKHLPRGPLGAYINVKDKKWDVAIEGFFGAGLLHSFTVDNKNDSSVLMEIFNRCCPQGRKPMIITGTFFNKVHNVERNLVQAPRDCVSLFDAINIKDPIVTNCLIDQMGMESILMVPSTERAIELLSNKANVPRNCHQGITIKGDKYYPDPNYKMYASRLHRAKFLQVDTKDLISAREETLSELAGHMKQIQAQVNAVVKEKHDRKNDLTELMKKLDKLKQTNFVAKRKLETLSSTEDVEVVNVETLEAEVAELKAIIDRLMVNRDEVDLEIVAIEEQKKDIQNRLNKLAESSNNFEEQITPLEQQIREQSQKKQELDISRAFEKKRLVEAKTKLESATAKMTKAEDEMTKVRAEAIAVCERMDEIRLVPEIVEEIKTVQIDIRKVESSKEDPAEVKEKYEQNIKLHQEITSIMDRLSKTIKAFELAIKKRNNLYQCEEDYFVNYINHTFAMSLKFRQFEGNLDINIAEKTLDLVVIPQQGSQGHTVTQNLSGGERSFSTVAFLYSLWQCTNFPFYFLDEFDVYMDKINRTKVMEILIHQAKETPDRQYVFLTPQDVSFIRDDDVVINRLEDPERRSVPEDV